MKPTRTSKGWMREHVNDPWVKKAQAEGWRSRAAFKLIQIDEKDKLLRPGMTVVDLGATPGGWSQVAAKRVRTEPMRSAGTGGAKIEVLILVGLGKKRSERAE